MLECLHQGFSSQAWWPHRQLTHRRIELPSVDLLYSMSKQQRRVACPFPNGTGAATLQLNHCEVNLALVIAAGGSVGFQRLLGDVETFHFENRGVARQRRR